MTHEQILRKAIEKAVKNGFNFWGGEIEKWRVIDPTFPFGKKPYLSVFKWYKDITSFDGDHTFEEKFTSSDILFSKTFAKAFWGEETRSFKAGSINLGLPFCNDCGNEKRTIEIQTRAWKYHLQQMVLEEDPIKYLEQFIDVSKLGEK